MNHINFVNHVGGFCCYHCGESYKCLPASMKMVEVISKQFAREHKKCRKTDAGEALETANIAKHKALSAEDQTTVGLLGPAKGCSMGEKIAFQMEMDILAKCLDGGDIPKGLADDPKFVKTIEELKKWFLDIIR